MDKLAKIICRNRKLTNQTARLFLEPRVIDLNLYDCTSKQLTGIVRRHKLTKYGIQTWTRQGL